MFSLSSHFARLIENANPPAERLEMGKTLPWDVRGHLTNHDLPTVDPDTRLIGSYARGTVVEDVKDVDLIVFVEGSTEDWGPNDLVSDLRDALNDYPNAQAKTELQRRSVHLCFENYNFHLDIVPALLTGDITASLLIPDRDKKSWVETHPLGYGKVLSELNIANKNKAIPLMRLLKLWRNANMTYKKPKSYWLECLIYEAFNKERLGADGKGYAVLFSELLAVLDERLGKTVDDGGIPRIFDPILNNNVAAGWEHSHAKSFVDRLRDSKSKAEKALEAETEEAAIEYWQSIFGEDRFPSSGDVSQSALYQSVLKGTAAVTATGTVLESRTFAGANPIPPVRQFGE